MGESIRPDSCGCDWIDDQHMCTSIRQCAWVTQEYCDPYMKSKGCAWTQDYNCELQPSGALGSAPKDGSIGYNCCCEAGLWKTVKACQRQPDLLCRKSIFQTIFYDLPENPEFYVARGGLPGIHEKSSFEDVHQHLYVTRRMSTNENINELMCHMPPCEHGCEEPRELELDRELCNHNYVPEKAIPSAYVLRGSKATEVYLKEVDRLSSDRHVQDPYQARCYPRKTPRRL